MHLLGTSGYGVQPAMFLISLRSLLLDEHDCIGWVDDGAAFEVNSAAKVEALMPSYFKLKQYASFQRQLGE